MKRHWCSILLASIGIALPALASEDPFSAPEAATTAPSDAPPAILEFDLPHLDYPPIETRASATSLYVDHTYESTDDLSTFWWVKGHGYNDRVAVGGDLRLGDLRLRGELPLQYTRLFIDTLMGQAPSSSDQAKSSFSLGDIITSATYFWSLSGDQAQVDLGVGMRVRWPTHTTKYKFGLVDGSTLEFGFPYYLHVSPGLLLSARKGPVGLAVSQGVLAMLAKDVTIGDVRQQIPNIYFWESHVAADLVAADWLDLSIELLSLVQLNRVDVSNMTGLNDTRAVFVNPGVTVAYDQFRLAVAGRFGIGDRSVRDVGVITFSGSRAVLARVSYVF
jgi:hypothetical protein